MTDGPGPPEVVDPALALDEAVVTVQQALKAIKYMLEDLATTPSTDPGDAKRLVDRAAEVGKSHRALVEALTRVQDDTKRRPRAEGGTALDLDAARVEIGRRLSKLRAAGGAGGVSEQPEPGDL